MSQPDTPKPPPNHKLQAARQALPSPSGAPDMCMSRRELAESANAYVWKHKGRQTNLSERDIGRYERGEAHWPDEWRRYGPHPPGYSATPQHRRSAVPRRYSRSPGPHYRPDRLHTLGVDLDRTGPVLAAARAAVTDGILGYAHLLALLPNCSARQPGGG